jgi:3-hydroxyisobutyrate dehydrogenase-like beta-hydroxyacid dehydrogenase
MAIKEGSTLGFIGLGAMGAPMARRLISHGYALVVHDINPGAAQSLVEAGATAVSSALEVANAAETVFVSLPNLETTREVALGKSGLASGSKIKLYIDLSTTGSRVAKEVSAALAQRNIVALDAPVTGGIAGAIKGTLTVMVSGPKHAFDNVVDVFKPIGTKTYFVGEGAGQAQIAKLINNLLSATALAVTSEAFVLGAKAGLDPDILLGIINDGTGRNTATADKFPKSVLPRKFDFYSRLEILYKDVSLCMEEADRLKVPMWIGSTVKQAWGYAMSQGGAKDDQTSIIRHFEKWVGVEVKGKACSESQ